MGLNLDLLKPYLSVVFQDVCISIGGGYAIDTRSGAEIGTSDIDGRLALISPACSSEPGSPACTCASRVQNAVDFFRRYWIQITRSSSVEGEPLHKWLAETFTEKLDDSDFLADPELFNGRRVGEFIGNTWVGTINNMKYMNKLILLVKTNGQAHKLIEIGFSSNMACSKLRMAEFVPAHGIWFDTWEYIKHKQALSLSKKSDNLLDLLGTWLNVEPTPSGLRYRKHLEEGRYGIESRIIKWIRTGQRYHLPHLERILVEGALSVKIKQSLSELEGAIKDYRSEWRPTQARAMLESVRKAEEDERARRLQEFPQKYWRDRVALVRAQEPPKDPLQDPELAKMKQLRLESIRLAKAAAEIARAERIETSLVEIQTARANCSKINLPAQARLLEEAERLRRLEQNPIKHVYESADKTYLISEERERADRMKESPEDAISAADHRYLIRQGIERERARQICIQAQRPVGAARFISSSLIWLLKYVMVKRSIAIDVVRILQSPLPQTDEQALALKPVLVANESSIEPLVKSLKFEAHMGMYNDIGKFQLIDIEQLPLPELHILSEIHTFNSFIGSWARLASYIALERVRRVCRALAASIANKCHCDNMSIKLFREYADHKLLIKDTKSLKIYSRLSECLAPFPISEAHGEPSQWLLTDPWQHVARLTLYCIQKEKIEIAKGLSKCLEKIEDWRSQWNRRTAKDPCKKCWTACYDEYKEFIGAKKFENTATDIQREKLTLLKEMCRHLKLVESRRDWFQSRVNVVSIRAPSGEIAAADVAEACCRSLEMQLPTASAWTDFCNGVFVDESYSEQFISVTTDGLHGEQLTLQVASDQDWFVKNESFVVEKVLHIKDFQTFMNWVAQPTHPFSRS